MNMVSKSLAVAASFFLAGMAGATAASAEQDRATLNVSIAGSSMNLFQTVPLQVAIEKGFLAQEGLDIHFVKVGGGTEAIDAAVAGKADIAVSAITDMTTAIRKGAKAVGIAGETATPVYSLVTKPDITELSQLKGKPVAVSFPTDIITIATQQILQRHGVDATAYEPRAVIGSTQRLACLQDGDCAAAALSQPFDIELENKGFHRLASSNEALKGLEYTVYAVQPDWAKQHRQVLVAFVRAMGKAYRYVNDPAHKDDVIAIASRVTGTDQKVSGQIYDLLLVENRDVLPKRGEIDVAGVMKVVGLMESAGHFTSPELDAGQLVDLEYLKASGLQ
jgi:ABC-type nitrate/sulfonate/bicarbonate transport system substrate-binding protein